MDPSAGDVYVMDAGQGVVDKFSATGAYEGQLSGTSPGAPFGPLFGVAVDPSGVLFVYTYQGGGQIDSFSDAPSNVFLTQVATQAGAEAGFAVDSEDDLYVNGGNDRFEKITSSGQVLSEEVDGAVSTAAAVNIASDEVFIENQATVGAYSSSGALLGSFGAEHLLSGSGIAVDATSDTVYVADAAADVVDVFGEVTLADVSTGAATNVRPASMTLNGTVNPDGVPVTSCVFEYGTSTSYGQTAACVQDPGSGTSPVTVSADLSGLQENVTYHFRLVASNAGGSNAGADGEATTPTTPVPPSIDNATSENLGANTVDLHASINPHAEDTTYHFEYGTSTAYGTSVPIPDGAIASSLADRTVIQHLSGLQPDTTYHWRVVASNIAGTIIGADHTFIYDTSHTGLPDNRAYEMVTPSQKNGAQIGEILGEGLKFNVAKDGSRVSLASIQCFAGAGSCMADRGTQGDPYLFSRTPGGWVTTALAPPATQHGTNTPVLVSPDAGTALFSVETSPLNEDDFWARGAEGTFSDAGPEYPPSLGAHGYTAHDVLATPDLSHVAWEARPSWPFDPTFNPGGISESAYEYVGAGHTAPQLVGVSGGAGSTDLISSCGTSLARGPGAMSADGGTVFFDAINVRPSVTSEGPCASGTGANAGIPVLARTLYARIDESRTVLISGRSPDECTSDACLSSPPGDSEFQGASADGSKVFFISTQQLTDNASEDSRNGDGVGGFGCSATVGRNGCNLYLYDSANPPGRNLIDVSAGDTSGEGPRVQGTMAVSADGSHVYFVARGVLGGANSQGQTATDGANNLYVFERDAAHPEGRVAFIATLAGSDYNAWETIGSFGTRGKCDP